MSRPDVLVSAKQGNPQAIKVLLYREINVVGIVFRVTERDRCLYVLVEGEQVPDEQTIVAAIHEQLAKLQPDQIQQLVVFGRRLGDKGASWQRSTELKATPTPNVGSDPEIHQPVAQSIDTGDIESVSAPTIAQISDSDGENEDPIFFEVVDEGNANLETTETDRAESLLDDTQLFSTSEPYRGSNLAATSPESHSGLEFSTSQTDMALIDNLPNEDPSPHEFDPSPAPDFSSTSSALTSDMETSQGSVDFNLHPESSLPGFDPATEEQPALSDLSDSINELGTDVLPSDSLEQLSPPDELPTTSESLDHQPDAVDEFSLTPDVTDNLEPQVNPLENQTNLDEAPETAPDEEPRISAEPAPDSIALSPEDEAEPLPDPWEGAAPQFSTITDGTDQTQAAQVADQPHQQTVPPQEAPDTPDTTVRSAKDLLNSISTIDTQTLFNKPEALVLFVWLSALLLWQFYVLIAEEEGDLNRGLSSYKLSARLGVRRRTLIRQKNRPSFADWSRNLDPDGYAWAYRGNGRYYPMEASTIEVSSQA